MPLPAEYRIEAARVRRSFDKAAAGYDASAVLQREVARRMAERLDLVKLAPTRVLDVGCGTGADLRLLARRYPAAQRLGLDFSHAMLQNTRGRASWLARLLPPLAAREASAVCADAQHLPLAADRMGLVWSNFMLHWLDDPLPALKEMHRVLQVDGLLMFATLGPDTLKELRAVFAATDDAPHVQRFIDMHDLGDMLVASGYTDPVMDMEYLTLTYAGPEEFLRDLRAAGSINALSGRNRGLMGRLAWQRLREALAAKMRDGRLSISFEIVYGHAWKAQPRVAADGRQIIRFDTSGKP